MYSKTVMDHFKSPRNVGTIDDADGLGEIGNPLCGDMMSIYLKIEDEQIEDIKFQTFGCGAAIAVSSMLTEIAKGKSIEEAKKITNKDVAEALDGLPKNKLHCSNLGADALQAAIKDYEDRKAGKPGLLAPSLLYVSVPPCLGFQHAQPPESMKNICQNTISMV